MPATAVAVAIVCVGLVVVQGGADDDRLRATEIAEQLAAPAGAQGSTTCRGDGVVACWEVRRPVTAVSSLLAESLGRPAGKAATTTCDRVPVGTTSGSLQADSCFVRVRFGDRGVFVFLDPLVERDEDGVATVVGSLVSVSHA